MQTSVFSHFADSCTIVARARAVRMSPGATPEAQGARRSGRAEGTRRGLSARTPQTTHTCGRPCSEISKGSKVVIKVNRIRFRTRDRECSHSAGSTTSSISYYLGIAVGVWNETSRPRSAQVNVLRGCPNGGLRAGRAVHTVYRTRKARLLAAVGGRSRVSDLTFEPLLASPSPTAMPWLRDDRMVHRKVPRLRLQ